MESAIWRRTYREQQLWRCLILEKYCRNSSVISQEYEIAYIDQIYYMFIIFIK